MLVAVEQNLTRFLQEAVASLAGEATDVTLRWEIPKDSAFGDLSCPVAFKLASTIRRAPAEVAETLVSRLTERCRAAGVAAWLERIEAKAGFVNVFLSLRALTATLRQIERSRFRYGQSRAGRSESVLMEFVSANPTGPLSVAHGRQAAVGDAVARILRSQGVRVTAEYYLNDEGRQIELLGRSLRARYLEQLGRREPFPEDGYYGDYLIRSAGGLMHAHRDSLLDKPVKWFSDEGMKEQLAEIKKDLDRFRLRFDRWTSQRWLRTSGRIDRSLSVLKARGALYESEGATWFASTRFGDDKDRVVQKRDGELTYLAPDIAYHEWKFARGYRQVINLWGPDHHGYIPRLKAAAAALGLPHERLVIRIVQLVTLSRQGKPVPMSKRQGEFVTFREVLDEVGVDATRFFYLMRTMDSHLDFDLDLAKSRSQENPVYYVQYAHARICSILAYGRRHLPWWGRFVAVDLLALNSPEERLLMRQLFQFPIVLRLCALSLEPHPLTTYLQKLAEVFHVFYTKHRVISEDHRLSLARLSLVRATRWVLANGLERLGIHAPHRM